MLHDQEFKIAIPDHLFEGLVMQHFKISVASQDRGSVPRTHGVGPVLLQLT